MVTGPLQIKVNGRVWKLSAEPRRTLLSILRLDLGLTGTKYGCGEGQCGACTVLLDGEPVHACQLSVEEIGHREVTTVEGLASEGNLNPVQRAFAEIGAFQCGFCTPGMVVSATALLRAHPDPTDAEIRTALDGNLCRCCGYARILRAVKLAAARGRGSQ